MAPGQNGADAKTPRSRPIEVNMPNLLIRGARERDTGEIVSLWRAAGLITPHKDPYEDILFCRESNQGMVLLGSLGNRIAASVMVGHDGHRGWLNYDAVHPDDQGSGFERQVVEAAEAWLQVKNVAKVQLMIQETNSNVRDVFTAFGYQQEPSLVMSKRFIGQYGQDHRLETKNTQTSEDANVETTVTYLEMLEPPRRSPIPPPTKRPTSLIRAKNPTIEYYRFLYETVGGPWTWVERRIISDDDLKALISASGVEIYVLSVDGVPAGYGEVNRGIKVNEVELSYFGLMPEFIGSGLGWYFINAMVDIAWISEPKRIWVHTCDLDHPRALKNYQKAGFKVFSQGIETIPDPRAAGLPLPPPHAERQRGPQTLGNERLDEKVVPTTR